MRTGNKFYLMEAILYVLLGYIFNVWLSREINKHLIKFKLTDEIDWRHWFIPFSSVIYVIWVLFVVIDFLYTKMSTVNFNIVLSKSFKGEYWDLPDGMKPFDPKTCLVNTTFEFYSKKKSLPLVGVLNEERTHIVYDKPTNSTGLGYKRVERINYYKIKW